LPARKADPTATRTGITATTADPTATVTRTADHGEESRTSAPSLRRRATPARTSDPQLRRRATSARTSDPLHPSGSGGGGKGREGIRVRPGGGAAQLIYRAFTGRAVRGLYGPLDRATCGLRAEEPAHGPPGHRTGPPVARKVRIGPTQVPGRFTGHGPGRGSRAIWPTIHPCRSRPWSGPRTPVCPENRKLH
jgi:hypothetical protein